MLALLSILLCAVLFAGALWGAIAFTPGDLAQMLLRRRHDAASTAFLALRAPRLALGALVGASLAVAGALLQGLLRNPLVDPYLTGASAGASCAIAVAIIAHVEPQVLPAYAFLAAAATSALTMLLAKIRGGISIERFLLAGISISAFFAAIVTLLIAVTPSTSAQLSILSWLGGTLAGRGWPEFRWASCYALVGGIAACALAPALNMLRLGDQRARALGLDTARTQCAIIVAASLLTAAAVSVSGMIGFVGLIVPHLARRLVGGDARIVIFAAALLGATSVVAADAVARTVLAPVELPLGVLLALIGVPIFVTMIFRARVT